MHLLKNNTLTNSSLRGSWQQITEIHALLAYNITLLLHLNYNTCVFGFWGCSNRSAWLAQVFSCCSSLLESDEAIVRQAAALTLAKILEGLDRDALTVSVSHNVSLLFFVVVVFHCGAFIHIACSHPIKQRIRSPIQPLCMALSPSYSPVSYTHLTLPTRSTV